ncbi:dihydroneopterin aldolase [Celeribacter sp.]|uniref:dihydroneopterin aldolase n=1 Tax=Celeribacter sp. TaxID=1890673 RepID=UPI003A92E1B6
MNDTPRDVQLAFDHPLARAEASTKGISPDRLSLRDYVVAVEIGAFEVERGTTQRLSFNIVVELRPSESDAEDDVDRILSYDKLIEAVDAALAAERVSLLETLAESIAARVLSEPQAVRTFVRIEKVDRGPFKLGVEIERRAGQGDTTVAPARSSGPRPLVVALSEAAMHDHLSAWVDAALARPRPVILVPSLLDCALRVPAEEPQRRVDLLALDQAAWAAAARDPRLTVRASRTEIDWAAGRGDLTIWAPSRLVLDAPQPLPAETAPVAAWLAEHIGAAELVVVDVQPPETCNVPMRLLDRDATARL